MRKAALISGCLHIAGILMIVLGLPLGERDIPVTAQPISVDVVNIADVTNPPKGQQAPKTEEEPAPADEPAESKPPPPPEPEPEAAEPEIVPEPEPEPEIASVPPEPQPQPEPLPEPEPKPAAPPPPPGPRVEAKPVPRPDKKPPTKPEPEPEPPAQEAEAAEPEAESFDSVLNDVLDQVASEPEETDADEPPAPEPGDTLNDPSQELSISEIDAVRRQIAKCWNIPAGAKDADSMVVEIKVDMRRDATVGNATIANRSQMASDSFYRAMAESALRAVLNPRCQPYPLPQDRFDIWRTMTLRFDPREMYR